MPSSACTRSSSAASRPRPCCRPPRPPPCCSGRCWHPGRSPCARWTAGKRSPRSPPPPSRLTSPPDGSQPHRAGDDPLRPFPHISRQHQRDRQLGDLGQLLVLLGQPAPAAEPAQRPLRGPLYNVARLSFEWSAVLAR